MRTTTLFLVSGLLVLAACSADESGADDGWTVLFVGESLAGWRSFKSDAPPAGWVVENGALHLAEPGGGDIMTDAAFSEFELEFEWRI